MVSSDYPGVAFHHGIISEGVMLPGIPDLKAPHDPLTDLLFLPHARILLQNQFHVSHGTLRIPVPFSDLAELRHEAL